MPVKGHGREKTRIGGLSINLSPGVRVLKTLFNIVGDRFKKLLNFDICVV